ncbi:4213_t:CDS:2, partial [Cetraspora pellucida]
MLITCSRFIQPTYELFSSNRSSLPNTGFQIIQPKTGNYYPLGSNETIVWDYPVTPNPEIYVIITATYRNGTSEVVFNKMTPLYPSELTYKIEETWSTEASYNVIIQLTANPNINATS